MTQSLLYSTLNKHLQGNTSSSATALIRSFRILSSCRYNSRGVEMFDVAEKSLETAKHTLKILLKSITNGKCVRHIYI